MFDRKLGILGRGDALQDERDLADLLDAVDIGPIEFGLMGFTHGGLTAGGDETLGQVALAPGISVQVDGHGKGLVTQILGLADLVVDPVVVTAHIQLKHTAGVGGFLGDLVHARLAHAGQHVGATEAARGLGRRGAATGRDLLQRPDGRQAYRQLETHAEDVLTRIHFRHVAHHARAQGISFDGHAVALDRGFGLRPAEHVVEDVLVQVLLRCLGELMHHLEFFDDGVRQFFRLVSHAVSSPTR